MALAIGASSYGNWSGSHAVQWDYNAPEFGDLSVGDNFQKHSYPWGILINATGRRFVDEGADFRNYTYAKYGAVVLRQPNNFAYQVFDKKIIPMLRDEYRIKRVSKVSANTIEEFAHKLEGVDPQGFLDEIKIYNAAVKKNVPFNPNIKDGRCTVGLAINKSNWANTIEEPPFEGYQVGCGVSFSFGGVRIDPDTGQVIDSDMRDPQYLEEARRIGLEVNPLGGEGIAALIREVQATPQPVVDRLRELLAGGKPR